MPLKERSAWETFPEIGAKLRCIKARRTPLQIGATYTVQDFGRLQGEDPWRALVEIREMPGHLFSLDRFEAVK
jgi:hypothetical protein